MSVGTYFQPQGAIGTVYVLMTIQDISGLFRQAMIAIHCNKKGTRLSAFFV